MEYLGLRDKGEADTEKKNPSVSDLLSPCFLLEDVKLLKVTSGPLRSCPWEIHIPVIAQPAAEFR